MSIGRPVKLLILVALLTAGCSSLPGLQALTEGQDATNPQNLALTDELVMADKTNATDPSLVAAADRIEAAATYVDVVEMRRDPVDDSFIVFMIIRPGGDPTSDQLQDVIDFYNSLRHAFEVTWLATIHDSERADFVRIEWMEPQVVVTLDHGLSVVGFVQLRGEISREDAVQYLSQPHDLEQFINLIVEGKLLLAPPEEGVSLYQGQPNHPMVMLPQPLPR